LVVRPPLPDAVINHLDNRVFEAGGELAPRCAATTLCLNRRTGDDQPQSADDQRQCSFSRQPGQAELPHVQSFWSHPGRVSCTDTSQNVRTFVQKWEFSSPDTKRPANHYTRR